MTNYTPSSDKADGTDGSTDFDTRDVRALTEVHSVLDDVGRARGADDLFLVVSGSGSEYLVDMRTGTCECPDSEYRDVTCKHQKRVQFATGEREIPAWVNTDGLDDQLGEHVQGPRVAAADGGIIVAGDGAELVDEDGGRIEGPFPEFNKYGNYTGHDYVRCGDCGTEAMCEQDLDDCCGGAR
ncbi:hypothetical protein [Haloarcula onubensis]|uniref:SWIM-type domain-containing protein n=1 Tax=Haloarcula onubensis TaxID=2950539 RepID=A0ABU2FX75_9EURY|nr:hypothetical protein [Halomicroarcula sp. S3CR25-11]MDS0284751.1 hypothetical protein [Halomicroarcula sp. S3CR25-11]